MSAAREDYENKVKARNQQSSTESQAPEKDTFKDAAVAAGSQMATQSAQQGNVLGTAGGGLMMTGNPYAMAAGLGLQVYAAGEQNKRAAEEKQRQEYNDRIARRQQMMQQIAQAGIQ